MPAIDMKATGNNIKALREENKYTVKDLQKELGLATTYAVYKWQNGETMPTLDNMVILAKLFGTTIDEMLVLC